MNTSKTARPWALLLGTTTLTLLLTGCEQTRDEEEEPPEGDESSVQTFDVRAPEKTDAAGDRLPADAGATALIPATSLFPGTAKIDPAIENPYAGDPEAVAAGERHFAAFNCSGCHAPLGGGGMGPPLSDDTWIYGSAPSQIFMTILHGRPEGMPAFGAMLPERTIWELVAYIETLDQIQNYAAEKGFDENTDGYRGTSPSN